MRPGTVTALLAAAAVAGGCTGRLAGGVEAQAGWRFPSAAEATQVVTIRDGERVVTLLASLRYAPDVLVLSLFDPTAAAPLVTVRLERGAWAETRHAPFAAPPERLRQLTVAVDDLYRSSVRLGGDGLAAGGRALRGRLSTPRDFEGCPFPELMELELARGPALRIEVRTLDVRCDP